jgi:hypothetical protein
VEAGGVMGLRQESAAVSRLRERHRLDTNHTELVELAKKLGVRWVPGPPLDGWAVIGGKFFPCEIKDPSRQGKPDEFTEQQITFFNNCRIWGTKFLIWRREVDVFNDYKELGKC